MTGTRLRDARVDILIPTHDHSLLLPYSVASAQEQTVRGVRIVVIGDGVGDDTRDVMVTLQRNDPELVWHDLPKAGRTGERHRRTVLGTSDADYVTYLGDDDLFFPDHVERMVDRLQDSDVTMPIGCHLRPDGEVEGSPWSLAEDPGRAKALSGTSLFSLTGLAHRMDAYRRLPEGWRDTPAGFYTDQYMLLQFLGEDWCRFSIDDTVTTVHLADFLRRDVTPQERERELRDVAAWMRERNGWQEFRDRAHRSLRRQAAERAVQLEELHGVVAALHDRIAGLDDALLQTRTILAEQDLQLDGHRRYVGELESMVGAQDGTIRALRAHIDHVEGLLETVTAERDALRATKVIRLRDAIVRFPLMRALLRRHRAT